MDFYLNYSSSIPYVIVFLASFFDYFFFFYLATMPAKKESRILIVLYLVINLTSLGMGQRGSAVLAIMFVISYYFLRNRINTGEKKWITRKGMILITMFCPIMLCFLFLFAYIRNDQDVDKVAITNLVGGFFYQQGVSVNVIGYAKEFEYDLPKGKCYSVGKIIDFINHNAISQIFFGTDPVKPQTVEHALEDHTLHAALTYMGSPNLYFSGGGYGGSFIADLWVDWGVMGIIVGSVILGICLAKIQVWCSSSFWKAAIGLMMYSNIIYAPRSNYIDFLYVFISFTALISFIVIYLIKNQKSYI